MKMYFPICLHHSWMITIIFSGLFNFSVILPLDYIIVVLLFIKYTVIADTVNTLLANYPVTVNDLVLQKMWAIVQKWLNYTPLSCS